MSECGGGFVRVWYLLKKSDDYPLRSFSPWFEVRYDCRTGRLVLHHT